MIDCCDAAFRISCARISRRVVKCPPGQDPSAVVPDGVGYVAEVEEKAIGFQVETSDANRVVDCLLNVIGRRDFVKVGNQKNVFVPYVLWQTAHNRISLPVFPCPCFFTNRHVIGHGREVVNDYVDYAVVERRKSFLVFRIVEGFGIPRVCERRFNKHKLVDDLVECVEPYLKKVEFVEETKAVVYHVSFEVGCQGRGALCFVIAIATRLANAFKTVIAVIHQSIVLRE